MWKVLRGIVEETTQSNLLEWLETVEYVAFDIETTSLDYVVDGEIVSYAIGNEHVQYITKQLDFEIIDALQSKKIVGANLMFDLSFMQSKIPNINVSDFEVLDIYQIEQRLTKGMSVGRSYAAMAKRYLNKEVDKSLQTSFKIGEELTNAQILYQAEDVKYPIPILRKQIKKWQDEGLSFKLFKTQNALVSTVAGYTAKGIRYDVEKHQKNTEKFINAEIEARNKVYDYLKHKIDIVKQGDYSKAFTIKVRKDVENINLSSTKQLLTLFRLFDDSIKSTRHGTMTKYILNGSSRELRELITLILEYRKYTKLVSTYGTKFLSYVHNGRIYTSIDTNTTTGRFSSRDVSVTYVNSKGKLSKRKLNRFVNFQNLPSNEIRECFLADEGYEFVTIDLDGCELRILAAQSKDPVLIAGVNGHLDLHSELATTSYRIITGDPNFVVSKKENSHLRKKHKPALFGMIYGAGPKRVSEVLDIPLSTAKLVWKAIREMLAAAFEYLDGVVKQALKDGYIISNNLAKSRLILSEYNDHKDNGVYFEGTHRVIRTLYNFRMQATNADMMAECLVNTDKYFSNKPADIRLSVYDELGYQRLIGADYIDKEVQRIIKSTCNQYLSDDVEMECSIEVANHWKK